MSKSFFCLLCLDDKHDIKKFKKKVNKLIKFDKKISNEHKIKSFFGENIDGNYNEFDNYLNIYYKFLLKTFDDIKLKLYYICDYGDIIMFLFEDKKYTCNTISLQATLESSDGESLVLNKKTLHIIPTLDTFTPPNNVTILINDDYDFDNTDC